MSKKNEKHEHEEFSSKISDEINCSICLDILVNPRTLVPCGHSFCKECCLSDSRKSGRHRQTLCFTKCPQCRQPIKDTVPSRQLENLITTLVTVPNLLFRNDDDKQHFMKRRKVEAERSATAEAERSVTQSRTKKRRRQHDANPQNNYSYATRSTANPQMFHGTSNPFHPFQPVASFASTTGAPSFDPMIAPLPPPYDFTGAGPVPILSFARTPISSSDASRRRPPQIATSTTNTSGISANDPICLE